MNILLTYILISSFQSLLSDSRPMTLCDVLYDHNHVSLHYLRNKIKIKEIKSKKIDKIKIKYKSSSIP